jgi:hypothetical protein
MKDVIVLDQAVPTSVQDLLENIALGGQIPWLRHDRATYVAGSPTIFPLTPDAVDAQQFVHEIYQENQPVSKLFSVILPVITAIPYTVKQMIRIKMNLCIYAQTDNPNAHGMPHVDFKNTTEQLISAIYYVNDSSGDTLIFDQRFGQSGPLTVKTRVTPKKGRLVVFDGRLLHAGNTPRSNAPRININFNAFGYEGAQTG